METRNTIARIFAEAINIAGHFEPSVQPIGNFENGFDHIFNDRLAADLDKVFTSHDIAPHRVLKALQAARAHIASTYSKKTFMGAPDSDHKLSRPDLPSDPAPIDEPNPHE